MLCVACIHAAPAQPALARRIADLPAPRVRAAAMAPKYAGKGNRSRSNYYADGDTPQKPSSGGGGDNDYKLAPVDPAWTVAKFSIRPSLDSTGSPFYGNQTPREYLSTQNMLRKVIAGGSHEACNRLGFALSMGGSTIQNGSDFILKYLGQREGANGKRDQDFLQSSGLVDIAHALEEADGLQWREAMEFFNEATDVDRTEDLVHKHARRWVRFVTDRSEALLPAFRRLAMASSKLYIYAMEALVQFTLASDIAKWQDHMMPSRQRQVPAVRRWLSGEPDDLKALVGALADSYMEQKMAGKKKRAVNSLSDGEEDRTPARRTRRSQPRRSPRPSRSRGRGSRAERRKATRSSDAESASSGGRRRPAYKKKAKLTRTPSPRRRRSPSGRRCAPSPAARRGRRDSDDEGAHRRSPSRPAKKVVDSSPARVNSDVEVAACRSPSRPPRNKDEIGDPASPVIARPLSRASGLSTPKASAPGDRAKATPKTPPPDIREVWPLEDAHAFAEQSNAICSAPGIQALSTTQLQTLLAGIPASVRKAHGLPVSDEDCASAQEVPDRTAIAIAKCVWDTKIAYIKLALNCFVPVGAKFRLDDTLRDGGLLRLLSQHTGFLDHRDEVLGMFQKIDDATDETSRDAATAALCNYEQFVLQTEVLDAGTASAYWEKSVDFALQHARREPSLVEMRAYMELVEDGALREALGLTSLTKFNAKIKPANWRKDAARLFTTVYLCYKSHMTHKIETEVPLTQDVPPAQVGPETEDGK